MRSWLSSRFILASESIASSGSSRSKKGALCERIWIPYELTDVIREVEAGLFIIEVTILVNSASA